MKSKLSLLIILAILILPVTVYSVLKVPNNMSSAVYASSKKPTVLEFSAPLCSECVKLQKVLQEVEPKYKRHINFQKINISNPSNDISQEMKKYAIRVVPTMIFLDSKGNFVKKTEGSMSKKQLMEYLDELEK